MGNLLLLFMFAGLFLILKLLNDCKIVETGDERVSHDKLAGQFKGVKYVDLAYAPEPCSQHNLILRRGETA